MSSKRFIISGGGTGGHLFPALSIAAALRQLEPESEVLFVGAEQRMEMERVPAAGYSIVGLPVAGFYRKKLWKNFAVLLKLYRSLRKAGRVLRDFSPDVVVGVGGYASGPTLRKAHRMGIPTLIQEQNSYAGLTNKLLAKKAQVICVAYEGMEKYFPPEKILLTGNPVRQEFNSLEPLRQEALRHFGLKPGNPVLLVLGGSLGARTINESMLKDRKKLNPQVQVLWQCGKLYYKEVSQTLKGEEDSVQLQDFIQRMDYAYAAADVIVSRAGAGTISELSLVGKPVVLVPSPNVAEDHQKKNALALVERNAARMVPDAEAREKLVPVVNELIDNEEIRKQLGAEIRTMALPGASRVIAAEILKLAETHD